MADEVLVSEVTCKPDNVLRHEQVYPVLPVSPPKASERLHETRVHGLEGDHTAGALEVRNSSVPLFCALVQCGVHEASGLPIGRRVGELTEHDIFDALNLFEGDDAPDLSRVACSEGIPQQTEVLQALGPGQARSVDDVGGKRGVQNNNGAIASRYHNLNVQYAGPAQL
ncbi:hypothetical protein V5799_015819 [Amblyomma americanum]|uniref:Uncharacterized protein n=1 Tax=Amblyomma americanum TaxID=6943 RepID=A0AAQ4F6W3_AMBAM